MGRRDTARVVAALESMQRSDDPLERLNAARKAREAAEQIELDCIAQARKDGATWAAIGKLYRLSKQGAQQRFRERVH